MSSDKSHSNDRNAPSTARARELPQTPRRPSLSLTTDMLKPTHLERSSDPYNTTGSFDRKKHWARVGKR